jgi:hypothetical protein
VSEQTARVGTEREAITRAALDYFEGWFDGDVERIDRALHPDLVKRRAGDDLHLVRTSDAWRIANALWVPS